MSHGRTVILDFGFAKERARIASRRPGAPPDGGTPNYMSRERHQSGGASTEDDVYAMTLTLLEMWTCRVPRPKHDFRAQAMRSSIMFDVPSKLTINEVKQIFCGLAEDPEMRPQARHLQFFSVHSSTVNPGVPPRESRLDAGPPPRSVKSPSWPPRSRPVPRRC